MDKEQQRKQALEVLLKLSEAHRHRMASVPINDDLGLVLDAMIEFAKMDGIKSFNIGYGIGVNAEMKRDKPQVIYLDGQAPIMQQRDKIKYSVNGIEVEEWHMKDPKTIEIRFK